MAAARDPPGERPTPTTRLRSAQSLRNRGRRPGSKGVRVMDAVEVLHGRSAERSATAPPNAPRDRAALSQLRPDGGRVSSSLRCATATASEAPAHPCRFPGPGKPPMFRSALGDAATLWRFLQHGPIKQPGGGELKLVWRPARRMRCCEQTIKSLALRRRVEQIRVELAHEQPAAPRGRPRRERVDTLRPRRNAACAIAKAFS